MTITYLSAKQIQGLSSDTKPTNVNDDSFFYETDTYTFWVMDSGTWKERSVRSVKSDYDVYLSGSTIKAKNNRTGLVEFTHASDVGAITNTILTELDSANGGKINYSNDLFTINTPIVIPKYNAGLVKPYWFEGYIPATIRDKGTQFKIGASFPDGDYVFKSVAADASVESASFKINGFFMNNLDYAKDGNGTDNILGSGLGRIDAGFLKFESDKTSNISGSPCIIENVTWHYFWRGIHLLGYIYWPIIRNCGSVAANNHFVGDFEIKLERGTAGAQHGSFVDLKGLDLRNFGTSNVIGHDSGRGMLNDAVMFYGGYHNISKIYIDGGKYDHAVISWMQCFSSIFDDITTIDLPPTHGSNFEAVFLLDTEDPAGQAASTDYSTYNNQIKKLTGTHASNGIKFLNDPYRNRIEAYAYWGANLVINDADAGIENIIELIEGQQKLATANAKITSSNSLVKIIDKRVGASRRGIRTDSGTGSQVAFNIPHGCFATPVDYDARPITADAVGAYDLSVNGTNITVTYKIAPPGGTDNLKYAWYAHVYSG